MALLFLFLPYDITQESIETIAPVMTIVGVDSTFISAFRIEQKAGESWGQVLKYNIVNDMISTCHDPYE